MRRAAVLLLALLFLFLPARAQSSAATRADFVTALWESAGAVPFDANTPFTDVAPTAAYAPAVGWACGEGILYGVGEDRFAPDRPITREEAAALLRRWAGRLGRSTFLPDGVAECNDYADLSPWADDSLYWACDVGLIPWSPEGRLAPQDTLTQEEIAGILDFFVHGAA